ncbi:MAG: type IV pilin-like G/H family protein [Leptolyngbyaceae cyanobacterium bins.59]|nr:type IV pilin-like G/H family protein [Leptolyngbyaceae cyanobacterium bins.59]
MSQRLLLQRPRRHRTSNKGFTLVELLIVVIIVGILATIAIPGFLNQATKAKQSEAKQSVGSMNRAQQMYYMESGQWATELGNLGLGISSESRNYHYLVIDQSDAGGEVLGVNAINHWALSRHPELRSYASRVELSAVITATGEVTTSTVFCETPFTGRKTLGEAMAGESFLITATIEDNSSESVCATKGLKVMDR